MQAEYSFVFACIRADVFVIRVFRNSALMLVCARLRHVAGSEWGTKRYLTLIVSVKIAYKRSISPYILDSTSQILMDAETGELLHLLLSE